MSRRRLRYNFPGFALLPIAVVLGLSQRSRLARSLDTDGGSDLRRRRLTIATILTALLPVVYLVSLPILGDGHRRDRRIRSVVRRPDHGGLLLYRRVQHAEAAGDRRLSSRRTRRARRDDLDTSPPVAFRSHASGHRLTVHRSRRSQTGRSSSPRRGCGNDASSIDRSARSRTSCQGGTPWWRRRGSTGLGPPARRETFSSRECESRRDRVRAFSPTPRFGAPPE